MRKMLYIYRYQLIALTVFCILLAMIDSSTPLIYQYIILLRKASIIGIVAVGLTFVVVTGGIDLSIGAILSMSSGICAGFLVYYQMPMAAAIGLSLALSAVFGLVNGLIVTKVKITPIITTLGTMTVFAGISLTLNRGNTIFGIPEDFNALYWDFAYGIPIATIIWLALTALVIFVFKRTYLGRYLFGIGDNRTSMRLMGINVEKYEMYAYMLCGLLGGVAGIVTLARTGVAEARDNISIFFSAMMAIAIGGISLNGARGRIEGVLIGTVIVSFWDNIMYSIINVDTSVHNALKGIVFLIAAAVDIQAQQKSKLLHE